MFCYFYFKIWHVVKFLIQNLLFKSPFQILAELLSKSYQLPTCWIMTMAWGKKIFYEYVACVCLTFGTIFLVFAFFMALGFLMGLMTISFALTIDLYKVSFSRCWAFCPLLFCWLKWTAPANYRRVLHSWEQFCHWSGTWKVYTNSPRVGSWERMHPVSVAIL